MAKVIQKPIKRATYKTGCPFYLFLSRLGAEVKADDDQIDIFDIKLPS